MKRMTTTLLMAAMVLAVAAGAAAQTPAASSERDAVYQAALDYVEGLYQADPSKIQRSVHSGLTKHGFMRRAAGDYGPMGTMTYAELVELAGSWNKNGKRDISVKKVEVLDVMDQTAVAKITAQWGIDHMQLAKFDGRWKIVNIVWQTHPTAR
jgi:hypothetical protein